MPIRVVLLDIEGTTTPIDFVYKVLFPYARAHVKGYLARHSDSPEVQKDFAALLALHAEDVTRGLEPPLLEGPVESVSLDRVVGYLHWMMERDSKATPLKSIQGKVWEEGYNSGNLKSEVFEDVPRAFTRWREQGIRICIYSSGSVLAQKLLFASTQFGDLTPDISNYFDTNIGGKREAESYRRISSALDSAPAETMFVSDVTDELDAAASAGLDTRLCIRPGNHPQPKSDAKIVIHTFDDILP
ncbi:MAG TPA: acireductone synthase [Blastocatellia bacterium]|nr:acireductone synthase [Blastocatellia bacterium]